MGVGGVGGALLEQVKRQQEWLKKKHIDLRVCGIANSKALLTNVHGLNTENWQAKLEEAKEPFNPGRLIRLVKEYHLLNPVIVDCTSSRAVADQYADFLREGFHVVTPNKRPTPRRWITITSCVWRRVSRAASFCMTPTWARACRSSRTCKTC